MLQTMQRAFQVKIFPQKLSQALYKCTESYSVTLYSECGCLILHKLTYQQLHSVDHLHWATDSLDLILLKNIDTALT